MRFSSLLLVFALSARGLLAAPIDSSPTLFPPGTILYHVSAAALTSVSPIKPGKDAGQDSVTLAFAGEWQINPELHGAQITPQAGLVISADTAERKRRLEELRLEAEHLKDKKIVIYVYAGAINKDRVTYAWPECVKIVAAP